jgi:hypothetical protein
MFPCIYIFETKLKINKLLYFTFIMYIVHCALYIAIHSFHFVSYNKPNRCTNFSNLFLNETLHISDSSSVHHQKFFTIHTAMVCHTSFLAACEQNQDGTQFHSDSAHKLSANLYDIYHCCVYSEKRLMMDRGSWCI